FHKNNRFCARKPLIFTVFHLATTNAIFNLKTICYELSSDFVRNKSAVPTNGQKCHVVSWLCPVVYRGPRFSFAVCEAK
ncbi:MAG: hypothetical protein OEY97_09310, partial [Nitrospirota bacterium]|nr:hypothetical protein [Nitrospirota bacterium]